MDIKTDFLKSRLKPRAKVYELVNHWLVKTLVLAIFGIGFVSAVFIVFDALNIIFLGKLEFLLLFISTLGLLVFIGLRFYYNNEIKSPRIKHSLDDVFTKKHEVNLANYLTINAYGAIMCALRFNKVKYPHINNSALFFSFLHEPRIQEMLLRMDVNSRIFVDGLKRFYSTKTKFDENEIQDINDLIFRSAEIAKVFGSPRVEIEMIFCILAISDAYFKTILFDLNLTPEDVLKITYWIYGHHREKEGRKFNPDRLKLYGGIGREWGMGYMPYLSHYAADLTETVKHFTKPLHLVGRTKEIKKISEILLRANHHNILMVGEPGIGKKTMIFSLAKMISEGHVPHALRYRRVMELNIDYVLAGATSPNDVIERLVSVFEDAVRAGNVILFIDNINTLFGGTAMQIGAVDASQILMPYLENPELYIIGTTTVSDFHKYIETKAAVIEKMERIDIAEPDKEKTLEILEEVAPVAEYRTGVFFSYEALKTIISLADQYIYNKYMPEKAIDLLDEIGVYFRRQRHKIISHRDVEVFMQEKLAIPIGEAREGEQTKLLKLEGLLHQRVIGQNEAIMAVANAMRRARAGIKKGKKPIGSFLFLGPTGVGKTETCKALAESYFGKEDAMIRFDMSEYQDTASIYRLIGAPPGYGDSEAGGTLTNAVKDHPFSLVLFDEIEKAHPDLLNLFLQMLDEGWLTDSSGRKIKFNNTIIIGTSNAGAAVIQEAIKANLPFEEIKKQLFSFLTQEGMFRPEFLNRFDAVVTFKPLTEKEITVVTSMLAHKLIQRLLEEKGIYLTITPEAVDKLAKLGYDPMLGARPIERVIAQKVEDVLAKKMLSQELRRGSKITISEKNL